MTTQTMKSNALKSKLHYGIRSARKKTMPTEDALNTHMNKSHGESAKCRYCGKELTWQDHWQFGMKDNGYMQGRTPKL